MKKKQGERIKYFIDSILKDEEKGLLTIQGWAFDLLKKDSVTIDIKSNENLEEIIIREKYRTDIIEKYNLNKEASTGFFITLKVKDFSGIIPIKFCSENDIVTFQVYPRKKYKNYNSVTGSSSYPIIMIRRVFGYLKRNGLKNTIKRIKIEKNKRNINYEKWIADNEKDNSIVEESLSYTPLISVVMPVYNVEEKWLVLCIKSVINQTYNNWELCIADDCSTKPHIKKILDQYSQMDSRIKVVYRTENGHICEATNSAIKIANGEYVALLDNDDELSPNALYEIAKVLNVDPTYDLIYSDEDKIDKNGKRRDPAFKSDWAPDTLLSTNYISHLGVYRKNIIQQIGGFRKGFEGAQDYDLVLRFTEKTDRIAHISKILYHWRMLDSSTAVNQDSKGYAFEAGLKALQDAMARRGIEAFVKHGASPGLYDVYYNVAKEELVSIIIPTRDNANDLKKCIDSIFKKTTYPKYEVIIANNGSREKETTDLLELYKEKYDNFKVVDINIPFNFSKINNIASDHANGKYLLFLNNDTEVINNNWLSNMVSFAQFERIGAVGAKLYYPDDTIQHAGVIVGHSGVAGHGHVEFPKGDLGYFGRLAINCNYLAVTAACMMVKKEDFSRIGGFNEGLAVAFNDVDLCIRLYEAGKVNVWLHETELYHFESKSRGAENTCEKQKRFDEEERYMHKKWKKYIKNDPYYNPNLSLKYGDYSLKI